MADATQLPHLIKLLDDDSEVVRRSVTSALKAFGTDLETELARLPKPPDASQLAAIRQRADLHPSRAAELLFHVGQIVQHKRYGYRGVIVAVDPNCQATEDWYKSNPTQPDRNQPWYHMLVHDADHTTYAAQSSLKIDPGGKTVHHPWLDDFFSDFVDGRYVRNNRPWMT